MTDDAWKIDQYNHLIRAVRFAKLTGALSLWSIPFNTTSVVFVLFGMMIPGGIFFGVGVSLLVASEVCRIKGNKAYRASQEVERKGLGLPDPVYKERR